MQIRFAATRPSGDFVLVLPATGVNVAAAGSEQASIAAVLKRHRFEGEAGSSVELSGGTESATRTLVVGLGRDLDGKAAEQLGGTTVARLLTSGEREAVIDLSGTPLDADATARVALAVVLRAWRYDRYRTRMKDKQKPTLETVTIVGAADGAERRWTERYAPLTEGVALTRELVTEPPNIIYPESFVERCRAPMEAAGLKLRVLDRPAMEKLGMGALLGVSLGSRREPQLLVIEWNGGDAGGKPLAFVGKGVTFDTGGISIKPAAGMESMKWDMGGAGAVAGAMLAIAGRKAKANIVGICGLVENMPDGNAMRPSDVVTTMSGQTVEVINTDAEGRLVLCDALTWVQKEYQPTAIVDLATLTGAMVVTFGHEFAGFFTNDDKLAARLNAASEATGDKLWRQPLAEAYDRLIDSPIADMKNVGPREAGSITAAQFLQRFVNEGQPWAHLDIAGMAWSDKPKPTYDKGATGYGVRLLDELVGD